METNPKDSNVLKHSLHRSTATLKGSNVDIIAQ